LRMAKNTDGRCTGFAVSTLSSWVSGNAVTPSFP
jgi:hypothetical protein